MVRAALRIAQTAKLSEERQIFLRTQRIVKSGRFGEQSDFVADGLVVVAKRQTGNAGRAARGRKQAGQHADGRGFAGAVRTQKSKNPSARDGEREIVHRHNFATARRKSLGKVFDFNHAQVGFL